MVFPSAQLWYRLAALVGLLVLGQLMTCLVDGNQEDVGKEGRRFRKDDVYLLVSFLSVYLSSI